MALRSATAPVYSYDPADMRPGEQIISTDPDTILDNQDWCTQRRQIYSVQLPYPFNTTSAVYVYAMKGWATSAARANYVGASGTESVWRCAVLTWTDDAATDWDVDVEMNSNDALSISTNRQSKIWRTVTISNSTVDLRTGSVQAVNVRCRRTAGTGTIYVAGLGIIV